MLLTVAIPFALAVISPITSAVLIIIAALILSPHVADDPNGALMVFGIFGGVPWLIGSMLHLSLRGRI